MLEKLKIRNYRIFKELKIDQLRRINLIAGSNNSGKTSLLEAIFLLSSGGLAQMLMNSNILRSDPGVVVLQDAFWKPLFSDLDMDKLIEIKGCHLTHGQMALDITWGPLNKTEFARESTLITAVTNLPERLSLRMHYRDPRGEEIKSRVYAEGSELKIEQPNIKVPFDSTLLKSRSSNSQEDAMRLARLRKGKRDHLLLEALRVVEPRLQSIEENSSSGSTMIWGDVGLQELVPLAIMGEGMSRLARLILVIFDTPDGVVLIDEIENGFHHSVLPEVWRVIDNASKQSNTQVFATTHSRECVRAAHESLGEDDFRLHRLEVNDEGNRCITYDPESIASAIKFNFEVR